MSLDRPIKTAMMFWLLFRTQDDRYESDSARMVIETISEQSESTITVLWNFAADRAREEARWN